MSKLTDELEQAKAEAIAEAEVVAEEPSELPEQPKQTKVLKTPPAVIDQDTVIKAFKKYGKLPEVLKHLDITENELKDLINPVLNGEALPELIESPNNDEQTKIAIKHAIRKVTTYLTTSSQSDFRDDKIYIRNICEALKALAIIHKEVVRESDDTNIVDNRSLTIQGGSLKSEHVDKLFKKP